MDWGMANRLARVIPADGRCYFLAVDHGYFQGPTTSLERPWEAIAPLATDCDAEDDTSPAHWSWSFTSCAVWTRSSGSFASIAPTSRSSITSSVLTRHAS